jgi:ATP-dependent DNA ligase
MMPETFDDGVSLYAAVCGRGLEGIVAQQLRSTYRPATRGSMKVKNPSYWHRDSEIKSQPPALLRAQPTAAPSETNSI